MSSNSLIELDRAHLIHPVSSYRGHEALGVRVLKSAKGAIVTDASGHQLLDGFAGLWCVNAGYGQDSIVEAATRQLRELPYATGYFGLGSEPAIRLAARLAELAPGDLNHVYFTLGGSDAIDSTIRFVQYYYHAKGTPQKDQFISVEQGYHGSSTAGAGLTALPAFHAGFGVPFNWQHKNSVALCLSQSGRHASPGYHCCVGRGPARQDRRIGRRSRCSFLCRADPGVRRRARAAAILAEGHARGLQGARHPVRCRRGHHRLWPCRTVCSPAKKTTSYRIS